MKKTPSKVPAIFVAAHSAMAPIPGGVQIFTKESHSLLELAGLSLKNCLFDPANGLADKIMRRLNRKPYRRFLAVNLADRVLSLCATENARMVILNGQDLAPLSKVLKEYRPDLNVILFSYGLESADYLHEIRTQSWRSEFYGVKKSQCTRLGRLLVEESKNRNTLDAVLCMSDFEAEIENWIGAKRVLVIPRLIPDIPFDWRPKEGRVGFVGRLDHPPNLEGLRLVLDAIKINCPENLNFRLVGAPKTVADILSRRYKFVDCLGILSEDDLLTEAQTWACSMNPVFCYARGASTKLAVLLGWGIPVITTLQGMRGYEWGAGMPTVVDTPEDFAKALMDFAFDERKRNGAQLSVREIQGSSMNAEQIAQRIDRFLAITQMQMESVK